MGSGVDANVAIITEQRTLLIAPMKYCSNPMYSITHTLGKISAEYSPKLFVSKRLFSQATTLWFDIDQNDDNQGGGLG